MILSLAIEAPLAAVWVVGALGLTWQTGRRAALAALAGTVLSHPVVWHASLLLSDRIGFAPSAALVEGFAILIEAPLYVWIARLSAGQALLVSGAVNMGSFLSGLLIAYFMLL